MATIEENINWKIGLDLRDYSFFNKMATIEENVRALQAKLEEAEKQLFEKEDDK